MNSQAVDLVYLSFFAIFAISGVVMIYVSHFKLKKMEACLSRSRNIKDVHQRLCWAGFWGRSWRLGMVAGYTIYPKFWVKRGLIDPDDLADFPKSLKLLAVLPMAANAFCFVAMGIMIALSG